MALFPDTVKHACQGLCGRCICRSDESGVNIRGGAGLGVAQTARDRCDRHMGRDQQAGVGVAQAVEVHRREVMSSQKPPEPGYIGSWNFYGTSIFSYESDERISAILQYTYPD